MIVFITVQYELAYGVTMQKYNLHTRTVHESCANMRIVVPSADIEEKSD